MMTCQTGPENFKNRPDQQTVFNKSKALWIMILHLISMNWMTVIWAQTLLFFMSTINQSINQLIYCTLKPRRFFGPIHGICPSISVLCITVLSSYCTEVIVHLVPPEERGSANRPYSSGCADHGLQDEAGNFRRRKCPRKRILMSLDMAMLSEYLYLSFSSLFSKILQMLLSWILISMIWIWVWGLVLVEDSINTCLY